MATQYGVISDVHEKPEKVSDALRYFKGAGVNNLLVVGDIGEPGKTVTHERSFTKPILDAIADSGLTAYVSPGSHETVFGYGEAINWFANNYPGQIIDVTRQNRVPGDGHDLIFLPGSDFMGGRGEYQLTENEESGRYLIVSEKKGEKRVERKIRDDDLDFESFNNFRTKNPNKKIMGIKEYSNMNDLKGLVRNPEKTIVVCHIPRKFDLEGCVDEGHFYSHRKYRKSQIIGHENQWVYDETGVVPGTYDIDDLKLSGTSCLKLGSSQDEIIAKVEEIYKDGFIPGIYVEKMANRGNKYLKKLFEDLGITKAISGHFHESVHRAHDVDGKPILPGKFVKSLFWTPSYMDEGKMGILTARGKTASYENIVL